MKSRWNIQLILSASLLSLGFGAEAEETKVLKKAELKKIAPIEMKTSLSPQLQNLNTPTVTSIQLDDVVLPPSLATQSPAPPFKERERPFPKWDDTKPQAGQRFFPVMADGKRVYVSLYGEGFSLSLELENKLREIYKKNNSSSDAFYVDGELADKILAELKLSKDEKLFWFLFSDPREKVVEIGKIKRFVIRPNGAGDGVFGALGVEVEANGKADLQSLVAQGLAHIGNISGLNPSMASAPKWSTTQVDLPGGRLLDQADYIAPRGETGSRDIKRPLEFAAEKLGEVEFIQANAEFNRKEFSDQNGFPENLYGYFLRSKAGIKALYDFYIDTTYRQKPERILVGQWVRGYDATLYISSTGMGDCGRFVFVKHSSVTVIPVRCGSWGC